LERVTIRSIGELTIVTRKKRMAGTNKRAEVPGGGNRMWYKKRRAEVSSENRDT